MNRKISLLLACAMSVGALAAWQDAEHEPRFTVASVKQNPGDPGTMSVIDGKRSGIRYVGRPLRQIIAAAYDVPTFQVIAPAWFDTERYDVTATAEPGTTADGIRGMLQELLKERFQMSVQRETRVIPGYILVVGPAGAKLKPPAEGAFSLPGAVSVSSNGTLRTNTIKGMVELLSRFMEKPILDRTGIEGMFDIRLEVSTDELPALRAAFPRRAPADPSAPGYTPSDSRPPVSVAIRELGLRLEPQKIPSEIIVVEKASKVPLPN